MLQSLSRLDKVMWLNPGCCIGARICFKRVCPLLRNGSGPSQWKDDDELIVEEKDGVPRTRQAPGGVPQN